MGIKQIYLYSKSLFNLFRLGDYSLAQKMKSLSENHRIKLDKGNFLMDNFNFSKADNKDEVEKKLIESYERFNLSEEATSSGSYDWDMQTNEIIWSDGMYNLFGLEEKKGASFELWKKVLHPEDAKQAEDNILVSIKERRNLANFYRVIRQDNQKIVWIEARGKTFYDGEKPLRMIGICIDITERKKIEEELNRSSEMLKEAQQLANMGHWYWDIKESKLTWSEEVFNIFGVDKANFEVTAESFEKAIHPQDLPDFLKQREEMLKHEAHTEIGHRIIRPDKEVRYVLERAKVIRDNLGNVIFVMGTVQDITKRKEEEEELNRSQERYRNLFQRVNSCVAVYSPVNNGEDFVFLDFNSAAEKTDQIKKEAVLGKKVTEIFPGIKEFGFLAVLQRVNRTGQAEHYPISLYKDSRIEGWRENYVFKLPGGEVIAIYEDITDRKKAEEKIKFSLKEKDLLLKELNHRVKNNLQVISSILSLQIEKVDNKASFNILKDIQARIRAIALVHEGLLQEQGLDKVDFSKYVKKFTDYLLKIYSADDSLKINLLIDPIYLDLETAIPVSLIINELVSNSIKHAFFGKETKEIGIEFHHDGQYTLIVRDNGIGFPKDSDFRNTKSLGMQLVNLLVAQLAGTIKLNTSKGTIFEIQLGKSGNSKEEVQNVS